MKFAPPESQARLALPSPWARAQNGTGFAGLQQAAQQIDYAARVQHHEDEQRAERAASLEATRAFSEARAELHQQFLTAQQQAPEDGAGFVDGQKAALQSGIEARLAKVSDRAKPLLEKQLEGLRGEYMEKAQTFGAGLALAKQVQDVLQVVNLNANHVRTAPDDFHSSLGLVQAAIDGSELAPAAKEKAKRTYGEAIAKATLQGMNESDPERARDWLKTGLLDAHLTPEAKNALVNDNQSELRRREAERKAAEAQRKAEERQRLIDLRLELADRIRDEEAASAEGKTTGLKVADVRAAYPDRPDVVERFEKKIRVNQDTAAARNELLAAPLDQEAAIIARFKPEGDNFANTAAARDRLLNLQAQKHQAINRDSAEYALSISRPLQASREQAFKSAAPQDFARYMRGLEQQQEALGLAPGQRMVLSKDDAVTLVERIGALPTADEKLGLLQSVVTAHGDQRLGRAALDSLVAAKLPDALVYALEAGADPARQPIARRLLGELSTPAAKINLTDTALKDVVKETDKIYGNGIGGVLSRAYQLSGNADYAQRVQQDAKALQHVTKTRAATGQDAAASSAYADLFGHLQPLSVGSLAEVVLPAGTDAAATERGLAALRGWAATTLLEPERPKDPAQAKIWERAVLGEFRRGATWVNAGEGYVLLRPGSGKPVAGEDGRPMQWTLDEILAAGRRGQAEDQAAAAQRFGGAP